MFPELAGNMPFWDHMESVLFHPVMSYREMSLHSMNCSMR